MYTYSRYLSHSNPRYPHPHVVPEIMVRVALRQLLSVDSRCAQTTYGALGVMESCLGIATSTIQWIGLRENLQETMDFPIKNGVFL